MKKYIYILFKPNGDIENITPHLTSTEMRERQARRYYRAYSQMYEPFTIVMSRFLQYKDLTYSIHNFRPKKEFFDPNLFINESINHGKWKKLTGDNLEGIKDRIKAMDLDIIGEKIKLNHSRGKHYKRKGVGKE